MSASVQEHRDRSPQRVHCGVLTISDTRTLAEDRGGALCVQLLEEAGHAVVQRKLVPDEPPQIRAVVESWASDAEVEAILLTGGTGISRRDQTYGLLCEMLSATLPGYGELFRMLSYQEIGAAAMLSRAVGGLIEETLVLSMPGSTAAVRLAMQRLIIPELGHLVAEARK